MLCFHSPPNLLGCRASLVWLIGLLCAIAVFTCAGCDRAPYVPPPRLVEYPEEETPAAAPAKTATVPAKSAVQPAAKKPAVDPKTVAPVYIGRDDDGPQSTQASVSKSEFPLDNAEWLPADFRAARQKHSPKLLQSVRQLGPGNEFNPDADENARLLGELLEPLPAPPAVAPVAKRVPIGYDDVDEPLVTTAVTIPGLRRSSSKLWESMAARKRARCSSASSLATNHAIWTIAH